MYDLLNGMIANDLSEAEGHICCFKPLYMHRSGYIACFNYSVFTHKLESTRGL